MSTRLSVLALAAIATVSAAALAPISASAHDFRSAHPAFLPHPHPIIGIVLPQSRVVRFNAVNPGRGIRPLDEPPDGGAPPPPPPPPPKDPGDGGLPPGGAPPGKTFKAM